MTEVQTYSVDRHRVEMDGELEEWVGANNSVNKRVDNKSDYKAEVKRAARGQSCRKLIIMSYRIHNLWC